MKQNFLYIHNRLKVYLRVYRTLLRLNWSMLFAYRASLINGSISHIIWGSFVILSMVLLIGKASAVYGWSRDELLVLAGVYNVVFSLFYFFAARNFSTLAETIHYGRLDSLLVKPLDAQFLLSFWFSNITQIIRLTIGTGVIWYLLQQTHLGATITSLSLFFLLLIASVIILYAIWMLVLTLLIWFTNLSNLADLLYQVNSVSRFPQELFTGLGLALFVILFPLTLVVVMPTKALLQQLGWIDLWIPYVVAFFLLILSRMFWKFALRSYTSASG